VKYLKNSKETDAIRFINEAVKTAKKALCLRSKCGSIIVKEGKIIGRGYNAPPLDDPKLRTCFKDYNLPQKFKYDRTCCVHAEQRAIFDALKNNSKQLSGSRLYFIRLDENGDIKRSGKPYCTVCSRLALDSGIKEFVLWHIEGICVYETDEYNRLSYEYVS
jgi:deoxycytidylate deaminase